MGRRAVIFVPGLQKRAQLDGRDILADAVVAYAEGYQVETTEGAAEDGFNYTTLIARNREGADEVTLDIYEAYWGDLIPDWSSESPWARFKRGLSLLSYWLVGGLARAMLRREFPTRVMVAMMVSGLALVVWYLIVIAVLLQALATAEIPLPEWLNFLGLKEQAQGAIEWLSLLPIVLFLAGLTGLGFLERTANVAAFAKAYLQDDTFDERPVGLRARSRQRVRAVLDHVCAKEDYDEVFVVAHSFGGPIALDALAEYGPRLEKIVFLTWGTAMGVLVQQEQLVEREIEKIYLSPHRIANWVDVVFKADMMGSKVPVPFKYTPDRSRERHDPVFPDTVEPGLPAGLKFSSARAHEGYFQCEISVRMLVQPLADLPVRPAEAMSGAEAPD